MSLSLRNDIVLLSLALSVASCSERSSVGGPMGQGSMGDADARRTWELQRLADPATGAVPDDIRRKELAFAKGLPVRTGAKSLTWTLRGPIDRGGRTRGFAVDLGDPNTLIAGGVTGGIWRSTDAGISWTRTSSPQYIQNISCLRQDPRGGQQQTWYAGTGENYGVVSGTSFSALLSGDGIFKSTDGGLSWQPLPSTVVNEPQTYTRNGSFKQVNSVVVDPTRNDSDVVLAAVFNGIFRSNDGGGSWHTVLGLDTTNASTSTYTDLQVTSTGVFYACVSAGGPARGLWRSGDGVTWTEITPLGFPANAERTVLAIDPNNEDRVYWFSETPNNGTRGHNLWSYTYVSGDGSGTGGSWENRTTNLPNGTCTGYFNFDFGYINSQSGYDMCIAVHPTDPNTLFIGGTSLYRSTDGFTSTANTEWIGGYKCTPNDPKDYVYDGHHPDQHSVHFDPSDPSRMYSTHDGGISVTTAPLATPVVWTPINATYITTQFYTVHMEEGGATSPHLIGGTQDNGTWLAMDDDPNNNWHYVHQDDGAYAAIPEGRAFYLTSSQSGRLYKKLVNASGTVLAYERIDPINGTNSYNFINQFVLDPGNNNRVYWVSASKIWRNNDLLGIPYTDNFYDRIATNWEQINGAALPTSQRITTLDISAADDQTLFYASIQGKVYRCDSLDTNPVKTEITGADMPAAYTSCVAPNDLDPDEWLLTFSNYGVRSIWHTQDGGASWEDVSGNLEQFPDGTGNGPAVFWALIYPTFGGANDRYFVGTSIGLFSTALLDGVNTIWEQEDPNGIGNVPVNMIAARNSDGAIAVATHGNGVYGSSLPAAPIGIAEDPGILTIGNAWPVPAVDHVLVPLYTPTALRETIVQVFDGRGGRVTAASLGTLARGNTNWHWDLRNDAGVRVSAGHYTIVFTAADGSRRSSRVIIR